MNRPRVGEVAVAAGERGDFTIAVEIGTIDPLGRAQRYNLTVPRRLSRGFVGTGTTAGAAMGSWRARSSMGR
jgi:hypothetical protein